MMQNEVAPPGVDQDEWAYGGDQYKQIFIYELFMNDYDAYEKYLAESKQKLKK